MEKSHLHILVVDDDKDIAELVRSFLREYNVSTAYNLEMAQNIVHSEDVDLIISDVNLGGASGIDLLREMQKVAPQTPVVLISGYDKEMMPVTALAEKAFSFVEKPFDESDIVSAVNLALRTKLAQAA